MEKEAAEEVVRAAVGVGRAVVAEVVVVRVAHLAVGAVAEAPVVVAVARAVAGVVVERDRAAAEVPVAGEAGGDRGVAAPAAVEVPAVVEAPAGVAVVEDRGVAAPVAAVEEAVAEGPAVVGDRVAAGDKAEGMVAGPAVEGTDRIEQPAGAWVPAGVLSYLPAVVFSRASNSWAARLEPEASGQGGAFGLAYVDALLFHSSPRGAAAPTGHVDPPRGCRPWSWRQDARPTTRVRVAAHATTQTFPAPTAPPEYQVSGKVTVDRRGVRRAADQVFQFPQRYKTYALDAGCNRTLQLSTRL